MQTLVTVSSDSGFKVEHGSAVERIEGYLLKEGTLQKRSLGPQLIKRRHGAHWIVHVAVQHDYMGAWVRIYVLEFTTERFSHRDFIV
jgi:hypothetical protein